MAGRDQPRTGGGGPSQEDRKAVSPQTFQGLLFPSHTKRRTQSSFQREGGSPAPPQRRPLRVALRLHSPGFYADA